MGPWNYITMLGAAGAGAAAAVVLQVSSSSVVQPDELRQLLKVQGPVDFKRSSSSSS
jgi:hypothetical protein